MAEEIMDIRTECKNDVFDKWNCSARQSIKEIEHTQRMRDIKRMCSTILHISVFGVCLLVITTVLFLLIGKYTNVINFLNTLSCKYLPYTRVEDDIMLTYLPFLREWRILMGIGGKNGNICDNIDSNKF